ncbi:MAG: hypothetical protein QXG77_02800 [Nitrososphaerota archaeon]
MAIITTTPFLLLSIWSSRTWRGIKADVSRLRPRSEEFLDMTCVLTPLSLSTSQSVDLSAEFEKLAKEKA